MSKTAKFVAEYRYGVGSFWSDLFCFPVILPVILVVVSSKLKSLSFDVAELSWSARVFTVLITAAWVLVLWKSFIQFWTILKLLRKNETQNWRDAWKQQATAFAALAKKRLRWWQWK